ncbi:phage tail tape measure protein [Paenibacillus radicis (ex Xue et al. 2023)]|uniref:Phage tail tape measure protein n=1 Tax=Paenibacillus radicis (ex Xue et al. 2023) TaxID=2972489 RepID=A0ABT1YND3_9BACL|nr:phage tail tape measure protein [Paenibacillus radicis (ex Xue et al. 2023)]MCR8633495.1 phage tail tape measure protein [Paenibacillus radicis (ex Xue et al. 2023)]
MSDESKDVVAARLQLDASKILPAFKEIDHSAKLVKETFETLNREITSTERSIDKMSKTMDKVALTSEERRQKILAESNALVAQRIATTQLLNAKKNALDATNQIVDAKLQAQQAIVKKREDAIEQQEKEHQQRMATLEQKTAAASGQENLMQAKIDREFQIMKNGDIRLEMEAERHSAMMKRYQDNFSNRNVLGNASQYLMAGSLYYSTVNGAKQAIQVIKEFEDSIVNVKRVMDAGADIKFVEKSIIQDAKDYGYALKDVGAVYVQIAQQGFNEKDTAALAKTALMAKNVESSFKDAEQAQQLLTGAILNYGLAAQDSERLLDSLNQVSNDYATDSNKLLQGFNRVGAAAKNANVPIDKLIGYLTVLNEAGFSGSVAGNAIKSFISFSSRDIAIDKLEAYVGTIKKATGEMMPFSEIMDKIAAKWKTLSDVQRAEVTQAVARGDQASRFIAMMDNYDKVLKVATTSENSLGSAQRENAQAMTTLSKQTEQLKASWEGLMISIGESGLLAVLKAIVHESKLLVDGFNSLPAPIRNTIVVTLGLGTAIAALNTGMRLLTGQSLVAMVAGLVSASRAMTGVAVATTTANVAQKAFIATPIGATLTALSVILGAATLAWSYYNGTVNESRVESAQNQQQIITLGDKYKELKTKIDDNTTSADERKKAETELQGVMQNMKTVMPSIISKWDEHGKALDVNIAKYDKLREASQAALSAIAERDLREANEGITDVDKRIQTGTKAIETGTLSLNNGWGIKERKIMDHERGRIEDQLVKDLDERQKLETKKQNALNILQPMLGPSHPKGEKTHAGSLTESDIEDQYKERKQAFEERMSEFRHLVNIESAGYTNASDQLVKLNEIRNQFKDLNAQDLYSIDEDIYRTSSGKKVNAKGMGGKDAFKFPLNDIDTQKIKVEQMLSEISVLIDEFTAKEFSLGDSTETLSEKTGLYATHQIKLEEGNKLLRTSVETLATKQSILNELYATGQITTDEYNKSTEDVQSRIKSFTDEINRNAVAWWNDAKAIKDAKDKALQDTFSFSQKWIAHEKAIREMSVLEELEAWQRIQDRYMEGTELRKQADEQVYAARKALTNEDMSNSEKWIAHQKAIGQLSLEQEIAAWERVQGRYLEGTDQRMKAEEQLYALKKATIQEDEKNIDELFKKQKEYIDQAKKKEIDAITAAKDAFISAQDAKIQAIEDLLKAEQTANEDQDYEKQLAEKQARVKVLESSVGADGKKERSDLLKEIAKLQEDHNRTLRKRGLESQKEALQNEKSERSKAFDEQKKAAEKHYNDLLVPLDTFKNDVEGRAEALKQLQILKESEKNTEILSNLDAFIAKYQEKMSRINTTSSSISVGQGSPTKSQQELDLEEYNRNKDLWEQAKADGNALRMEMYNKRNEEIRRKYNIPEDSGKLQHFKQGGIVRGLRNEAVPVVAHGGELFLNEGQQANLFKLLNVSMPQIQMPDVAVSGTKKTVNHYYSFDNSIGEVALTGTNGVSGLYDQRTGLIERQRSLGEKVR